MSELAKKGKKKAPKYPPGWVVSYTWQHNGRHVEIGTELSIKKESGRFRFIKHVVNGEHEWIDVVGGKSGNVQFRSFAPERVKTVHRLAKLRPSA